MDAEAQRANAKAAGEVARWRARELASTMMRTANALERSAELAEEHARRCERTGRGDPEKERRAATRAHHAAKRARSHATDWLELSADFRR